MTRGLFHGVTVLDFSQVVAGPFATMQLALQGADVIKIERPGTGDMMRSIMSRPPFEAQGTSAGFIAFNLSKRSLTLDLKSGEARRILTPLIARADVVVESFRPGVMASLGLDADSVRAIRKEIVYCSISGYGQTGPRAAEPAYDGAIQAESGMMSVTGDPDGYPTRAGYFAVDIPTGYAAAFAIAAGLFRAKATGEGATLDVSMMDTALSQMAMQATEYFQHGTVPERLGNMSAARMPSDNAYRTRDGAIGVVALSPAQIASLNEVLDLSGEPTAAEMAAVFETESTEFWRERLGAAGVPSAAVRDLPAALADAQLKGRAIVVEPGSPPGFENVPLRTVGAPFSTMPPTQYAGAAPPLGQHTDAILLECGFEPARIADWRESGVI